MDIAEDNVGEDVLEEVKEVQESRSFLEKSAAKVQLMSFDIFYE